MKHGSLFSGIGGFDLAAEWAGWENMFHCEWNPFGQKVLKHYWPNAATYEDITKTDFTIWRGRIDILTGGFPCQPYSAAGKRLGKEDERHLWPEMLRAIREIQPRWVVGENVLGLVNWNGGLVFEEVQADLEAEGYEIQPFILPAASVNAPHKRDRVWFVAYSDNKGRSSGSGQIQETNGEIPKRDNDAKPCDTSNGVAPDTDSNGFIEKRGHDSSGKNDAWSNAQGERAADTKNPNGCDSHGIPKEQSSVSSNISGKANVEKNKIAKPTRFCELDSTNNTERIVNEKQDFIVEGGTLVSERPSGVFSPVNRGLECNQNLFDGMGEMGASNDIPRIKSMDGPTPHTNHNGYATTENGQGLGEGNDRNKTGQNDAIEFEGRAVSDGVATDTDTTRCKDWAEQHRGQSASCRKGEHCSCGHCIGITPDTDNVRLQQCKTPGTLGEGQEEICGQGHKPSMRTQTNECFGDATNTKFSRNEHIPNWDNFPTQSPICSRNDGLSSRLDGITFSKWRNESIKAAGNAIVPQVVHQIFKAINEYENLHTNRKNP